MTLDELNAKKDAALIAYQAETTNTTICGGRAAEDAAWAEYVRALQAVKRFDSGDTIS